MVVKYPDNANSAKLAYVLTVMFRLYLWRSLCHWIFKGDSWDIYGYALIAMDIHGCLGITYRHPWISLDAPLRTCGNA